MDFYNQDTFKTLQDLKLNKPASYGLFQPLIEETVCCVVSKSFLFGGEGWHQQKEVEGLGSLFLAEWF
jgi:hypothetical protein